MSKKGFLNKNNERIENFNNSNNVNNQGLKLNQYLEKIKYGLSQLIHLNRPVTAYAGFTETKIEADDTYQEISKIDNTKSDGNIIEIVEENKIKFTTERANTHIDFNILCITSTPSIKFATLEIKRGNSLVVNENISAYINQRGIIHLPYFYKSKKDDILTIKLYGKVNDTFIRPRLILTSTIDDKNYEKYI